MANVDLEVRNLQSRFHALDAGYRELFDYVLELEKVLEMIAEGQEIKEAMEHVKTRKPKRR